MLQLEAELSGVLARTRAPPPGVHTSTALHMQPGHTATACGAHALRTRLAGAPCAADAVHIVFSGEGEGVVEHHLFVGQGGAIERGWRVHRTSGEGEGTRGGAGQCCRQEARNGSSPSHALNKPQPLTSIHIGDAHIPGPMTKHQLRSAPSYSLPTNP